ncbi:hypothetical protein LTR10_011358 [Elasticomyces elasticus]|nr:hypothetical protein LTR10_011358 [Elasticomyces elasticus]
MAMIRNGNISIASRSLQLKPGRDQLTFATSGSSACLLQPPVALVNSQLRAESLPLFYATNMFKIMLPDPPKVDSALQLPLAMAFLRGIGDTHLRDMRHLSLQTISKDGLIEVTNVKGECSGTFTRAEVKSKDRVFREFQSLISPPERIRIEQDVATRSQENAVFRQWMEEGGTCVRIIERAVSLFNQRWEARLELPAGLTAEDEAASRGRWAEGFPFW